MRIAKEVGLSCSIGLGYNMMSAKIASEENKPGGLFVINDSIELANIINQRDIRVIYGIGAKTAKKLNELNICKVSDILINEPLIKKTLGNTADQVINLAKGIDFRGVKSYEPPKSIGREHTFQKDVNERTYLKYALLLLSKELAFNLNKKGIQAKTITLKIKFANMQSITRSHTEEFTNNSKYIFTSTCNLLDKIAYKNIRLIGISLSNLSSKPIEQLTIFENKTTKTEALNELLLKLQYKYGIDAINTGQEILAKYNLKGELQWMIYMM